MIWRVPCFLLIMFTALCTSFTSEVQAHDARPLSITIIEQAENSYRVVLRAPPTLELRNAPIMIWPLNCEILESAPLNQALGSTSLLLCAQGLESQTLQLEYPSFNPSLTTLFRLENLQGVATTVVLPPDKLSWIVPENPGWQSLAVEYTKLGMQHIWAGIDHLLFVAGLLLLARSTRRIFLAISGFTIAHSITLSLATLGIVKVPVTLVEAMIALSILFLAAEIARNDQNSFSHRYPVALSFIFGLLHGFGFASALGEISLPDNEIITGLLFFNIGVELGQLAFIAAVLCSLLIGVLLIGFKKKQWKKQLKEGSTTASFSFNEGYLFSTQVITTGAYILGIPAAYWFIERSLLAL